VGDGSWNFVGHPVAPAELDLTGRSSGNTRGSAARSWRRRSANYSAGRARPDRLKRRECREFLERLKGRTW